VALVLGFAIAGCAPSGGARLTSVPVKTGAFAVEVVTTGTVKPKDSHNIALPSGLWGNIEALAPEGARIKKGDFLARIGVREIEEELHDKQDVLAEEQRKFSRQKAEAPVKKWEIEQEILEKERDWKAKDVTYQTAVSGGKPEERANAQKTFAIADVKVKNDVLAKKESLYEKGVIAETELAKARLDRAVADLERRRARLALAMLDPGAQTEEIDKKRLEAGKARAEYEGIRIEAPAKEAVLKLQAQKSKVRIKRLKKQTNSLAEKLKSATLYAPADGVLLYPLIWDWKKVNVGMQVWEGLNFLQLAQLDALKLEGSVSEQEIGKVHVGARVEITADGYPGTIFPGKVSWVSKLAKEAENEQAVPGVKRFDIEVTPQNKGGELRPNMRVKMRIVSEEAKSANAIPQDALFGEKQTRWVWLDTPKGPEKRPVTPTLWGRDWVALKEDLGPNAKVFLLDPTASPAPSEAPDGEGEKKPEGTP
jgi:multidrug resistance efflux pump